MMQFCLNDVYVDILALAIVWPSQKTCLIFSQSSGRKFFALFSVCSRDLSGLDPQVRPGSTQAAAFWL